MQPSPDHGFDRSSADPDDPNIDSEPFDWSMSLAYFESIGAGKPGNPPMPEFKNPGEVRREAKARSDKIFTSYQTLHEILERHEATIQKRWIKKSRKQRLNILLNAWPNMPTSHRPDFDAHRRESQAEREKGTKHRASFMWPYVNQDDLLKTKPMLLFINSRGRHPPSYFAAADMNAMHLGFSTRAMVLAFLPSHFMILNGFDANTKEYGKLISRDKQPVAYERMKKQNQFRAGEGLVVLEVQDRLLTFLIQYCIAILHDIPESELTSPLFPVQSAPQLKLENEVIGFSSLATMAAEAPYRVPAKLDLHLVESLLTARASAAEDHLWALREDPGYFAQTVLEAREHRPEMLKDLNGNSHSRLGSGRQEELWCSIVSYVISGAYLRFEFFSDVGRQAKELSALQVRYAKDISPSKDLPEDYLAALLRFRFYLNRGAKGPLGQLNYSIMASPPLRRYFARDLPSDRLSKKVVSVQKPGFKFDRVGQQLIWLLRTLAEDGWDLSALGLPLILDELERLIDSEPRSSDLLSTYVTQVIGDLSIISQCINQLQLYQPWARTWESPLFDEEDNTKQYYAEQDKPWTKIVAGLAWIRNLNSVTKFGNPSDGKFVYPIEKRRTRENVESLRRAEANLDAFWAAIDKAMLAKASDLSGTAVHDFLSQHRVLQRTEEWVAETPLPPSAEQKIARPEPSATYEPISGTFSESCVKPISAAQPKTKSKTRGVPRLAPVPLTEDQVIPPPNVPRRQPTFTVDARALKVFRTIFHSPSATSAPGEIPWNDFLHAMASVGFTIMKLYGSVWMFEPTNVDLERNIQFHEPHPRGKLPFTIARRYGRRLNRAYGWVAGMFVLGQKSARQVPT